MVKKIYLSNVNVQAKSNFYTTCQPPRVFQAVEECDCSGGRTEPDCRSLQLPARY